MANRRYPCGASFFMSEEMDATIRSLATGSYLSDVIRELLEEALKAREDHEMWKKYQERLLDLPAPAPLAIHRKDPVS